MATNLRAFSAGPPRLCPWGGGHTAATDPTRRGWRCRRAPTERPLWLIGQRGVGGCASLCLVEHRVPLGGSVGWDVAFYMETPAEVIAAMKAGDVLDARYVQVPNVPGFGLRVIREIEKERNL